MGVKRDQLPIEHELTFQIANRIANLGNRLSKCFGRRELPGSPLHGNASIAIEFDLKCPLLTRRQFRHRLGLHRLDEGGFRAPPRSSALRARVRDVQPVAFPLRVLVLLIRRIERPLSTEVSSRLAEIGGRSSPALISSHLPLSSSRLSLTNIHSPFSFLPLRSNAVCRQSPDSLSPSYSPVSQTMTVPAP